MRMYVNGILRIPNFDSATFEIAMRRYVNGDLNFRNYMQVMEL